MRLDPKRPPLHDVTIAFQKAVIVHSNGSILANLAKPVEDMMALFFFE